MIYLDSCIVIYAVEDDSERGHRVRQRMASKANSEFAVSPLVMLECLVGPLRSGNPGLRDHYQRALTQFRMLPSGVAEFARAAELRALTGLRTPDAIHLATAQLGSADELWTNDARLGAASRGLAIDVLAG